MDYTRKLLVREMDFWRRCLKKTLKDELQTEVIGEEAEVGKMITDRIDEKLLVWYGCVH
jgi:hypothetical protein